jgi:hypothetical protein
MRFGEMRLCRRLASGVCVAALVAGAALAAPRGEDADWPCQQRLMPTLGAATLWSGPPLDSVGDWQAEPRIAELVARIAPRNVSAETGGAAITEFLRSVAAPEERKRLSTLLFSGLLAEANRERGELIARLKVLGHRQHELAAIASHAAEELNAIPVDATGDEAARRTDLQQRFTFVTQAFESTQRTMRYACEAPGRIEARLGRYAQAIQQAE